MTNQTHAHVAMENLKRQFFTDKDRAAFEWQHIKPYLMVCHGCGTFHVQRSAFISSPLSMAFRFADGSILSVPCHNCGHCPGAVIREAWANGSKPEVWAAAQSKLGVAVVSK